MKYLKKKIKNYFSINIIKGYKKIKKEQNLKLISIINDDLTKTNLKITHGNSFFFGKNQFLSEISIRQSLLKEVGSLRLNKLILFSYSLGISLCYPLTNEWINVLEKNKIKVNRFVCKFLWKLFLLYKIILAIKLLFDILKYNFFSKNKNKNKFYYFFNLSNKNIPNIGLEYENFGIFDIINRNEDDKIIYFKHNINKKEFENGKLNINYQKFFFKPNNNIIKNVKIFFWFLICFFISVYGFLFSWKYPYFFYDSLLSMITREYNSSLLPTKSFFNQSSYIYRPYWTYFLDNKKNQTIFYFYSTNILELHPKNQFVPDFIGWSIITWNNFYFWDNIQKKYIEKFTKNFNFKITGPINFYPSIKSENIYIPSNNLTIFDVRPSRMRLYSYLGKPYEFYTSKNMIKFVRDIYVITSKLNINLVIKQKRKIADSFKLEDPQYISFIKNLSKYNKVYIIEDLEGDSLKQIFEKTKLCISIPFTSTAILSRQYKSKSIYYDPTGEIEINDINSHNITTIQDKDILLQYIKKLFKS